MGQRVDHGRRLTEADRLEIQRRVSEGETFAKAAAAVGCSTKSIQRFMNWTGGMRATVRKRSPCHLSLADREELSRRLLAGDSLRRIAARLRMAPSTISREVGANGSRASYRAWKAEDSAAWRARRPKPYKLAENPRLRQEVERKLALRWSPQQISARLIHDYPDDQEMRVSHETIYRSLFVQARGALRKELTACLRTGRTQRRSHKRTEHSGSGRLRGMVMISDRPAEASDRAIPGHWEGDLIMGKGGRSAIGTLVERSSRYVMLVHLPHGRTAEAVRVALTRQLSRMPADLRRTLTWDQGKEMAEHVKFTVDTKIDVFFCDPHSPWQRGSNENSNGLLRQYFPRNADLNTFTRADLAAVAREINSRPRQTLGWMKPCEVFRRTVESTLGAA
jgi:transposase, IS30 family